MITNKTLYKTILSEESISNLSSALEMHFEFDDYQKHNKVIQKGIKVLELYSAGSHTG